MYAIVLLLLVAVLSLLITRIATVALTVTGMPRESARFQARSALTGSGFTTQESGAVVSHPVRRRIVMGLMLIGSAGLVTAVAGLLGGFLAASRDDQELLRAAVLVGGLFLVHLASRSNWVDRHLSRLISRRAAPGSPYGWWSVSSSPSPAWRSTAHVRGDHPR